MTLNEIRTLPSQQVSPFLTTAPAVWIGKQMQVLQAPLSASWNSMAGCLEIAWRVRYIALPVIVVIVSLGLIGYCLFHLKSARNDASKHEHPDPTPTITMKKNKEERLKFSVLKENWEKIHAIVFNEEDKIPLNIFCLVKRSDGNSWSKGLTDSYSYHEFHDPATGEEIVEDPSTAPIGWEDLGPFSLLIRFHSDQTDLAKNRALDANGKNIEKTAFLHLDPSLEKPVFEHLEEQSSQKIQPNLFSNSEIQNVLQVLLDRKI